MDVICPCNNCSEHIEFEESAAGSTVACPHCGIDTVLFIPKAPEIIAHKIVAHERKTCQGGIEDSLADVGGGFPGAGDFWRSGWLDRGAVHVGC